MSVCRDVKVEKLENLLEWLEEQRYTQPSEEIDKLIKRVEQQIAFLRFETYIARQ